MIVRTLSRFDRHYRKLTKNLKEIAKEKEKVFRENPYHQSLRTHPLHGKDRGAMAFWINRKYRIKFIFLDKNTILFLDIGTHDIYE